jgi:hypothetical protein
MQTETTSSSLSREKNNVTPFLSIPTVLYGKHNGCSGGISIARRNGIKFNLGGFIYMKRTEEVEDLLEQAVSKLLSVRKMFVMARECKLSARECFGTSLMLGDVATEIDKAKELVASLASEETDGIRAGG